ncbi:hypothetical protein Gocc_1359 [Gaiella occulta]|uniref:EfeO-type cupredoxin-like domain-containing protein n=1 Tax=Gaiella occulta TaxID=1002870 RepID=A0A7M2Z190_9ACTN|nr:hypothetical protein [Gaiella occulta]RDI75561.1 hypothetical protein Gocc_1359 [Gaiella occulta]
MGARILLPALALPALAAAGFVAAAHGAAPRPGPVEVDAADYAYVMPSVVKGGVVAMRFRNTGKEPHEFAFGRIDKGHTFAQALRAFDRGKDVAWVHDFGGPPLLTPGAEITITRKLPPGNYFFICAVPDAKGVRHSKLGMARAFTITGDSGAQLPKADAVITAGKKRFVVPQLQAGRQTIELRNRAGTGRGFGLVTLNPGKTKADVDRWVKSIETTGKLPAGPMPMTFLGAMQTIPSGTSVYLTVNLEAGRRYRVSDDESGIQAVFTPR